MVVPSLSRVARYGGGSILVVFAAAFFFWQPFHSVGAQMTDFSAYYAAGRTWAAGGDPYSGRIWTVERTIPGADPNRRELLPFVGPPLSLPLWAALGALPYPLAATVWGIVVTGCAALVVIVPARIARSRIRAPAATSLLLLALTAGPLITGISVGQAALPACAAVDIAILCAAARRWIPMALATIAAGALKPNDALAIAATLQTPAALIAGAASGLMSALAALPAAGGLHGLATYLAVLARQGASERFFTYQMTPASIAFGFGMPRDPAVVLGMTVSVAALGAVVIAIRRHRAGVIDAAAIACAAFPFVVPFDHETDLAIVFLPALLVVLRARGWAWAIGALGMVLLCANPFALAQGRLGLAFTIVMSIVAGLQLAALAPRGMRWMRFTPFAVIPLLLLLAFVAPRARLPMWPAALPEHVTVAANAPADVEWHAEIAASRLDTPRPWVALLRLLTLAGCGAIAGATIASAGRCRLIALAPVQAAAGEAA